MQFPHYVNYQIGPKRTFHPIPILHLPGPYLIKMLLNIFCLSFVVFWFFFPHSVGVKTIKLEAGHKPLIWLL